MSTEAAPAQVEQTETPAVINPEANAALLEATLNFAKPAEIARLKAAALVPPKEEAAVTETPKTEEVQEEVQKEPVAETEETQAAVKAPESTEEETDEPKDGKPRRFRFANKDDEFIALTAKTLGISIPEAVRRLSGTPETPKTVPNLPPEPTVNPEITQLETELEQVAAKLDAAVGTNPDDAVLITPEIRKLQRRESELVADIRQAKAADKTANAIRTELTEAEFKRERDSVLRSTAKVYPQMADKNSDQFLMAQAIGMQWRDEKHPDHAKLFQVDGPKLIAEEAAKRLKLIPATAPVKAVETKTVEKPKPGPAPGSRQSVAPTAKATAQELAERRAQEVERALAGKAKYAPPKVKSYVM